MGEESLDERLETSSRTGWLVEHSVTDPDHSDTSSFSHDALGARSHAQNHPDDVRFEVGHVKNELQEVRKLIDKWFVDRRFGFGKVQTGETVLIHASVVQGAKVHTIDSDAWLQVVTPMFGRRAVTQHGRRGERGRGPMRMIKARRVEWRFAARSEEKFSKVREHLGGLQDYEPTTQTPRTRRPRRRKLRPRRLRRRMLRHGLLSRNGRVAVTSPQMCAIQDQEWLREPKPPLQGHLC